MEDKTTTSVPKAWYRPEEAAAYLGLGRTRIYSLLVAEEIPSVKVGRTRHVRRVDLDGYMERKHQKAKQKAGAADRRLKNSIREEAPS
jgi:excisionase family DNA binding protein